VHKGLCEGPAYPRRYRAGLASMPHPDRPAVTRPAFPPRLRGHSRRARTGHSPCPRRGRGM